MKNNRLPIILIICSIITQRVLFELSGRDYYSFPFASDMMIIPGSSLDVFQLLYSYIPIVFILFEFWGRSRDLVKGYGKLLIIRSYNRSNLCLVTILRMAVLLSGIVLFQSMIFCIGDEGWERLSIEESILTLCLYYLGILGIVLLQFLLELLVSCEFANIITNIFVVLSLFIGFLLIPHDSSGMISMILFPNLAFASRNGIINQQCITVNMPAVSLLVIIVILLVGSVAIFKKKDIL